MVVALCVALAASACSGSDKKPSTLPPLTSTPTASAAPSVPPFPPTKQGAAAFTREFFRAENHATQTGDVTRLRALSEESCVSCNKLIDYFVRTWRNGSIRGEPSVVRDAATALISASSATVTVDFAAGAYDELDASGKTTYHSDARNYLYTFVLDRVGPGWRVRELRRNS